MTVIAFTQKSEFETNGWTLEERRQFEALHAARANCGEASDWAVATTDAGDPQFFLLGPAPACDCVLSISRIGHRYVIEDGNGGAICEALDIREVFDVASRLRLTRVRTGLVARLALAWCTFREFAEEKVEPIGAEIAEVAEVLSHVAPQIAAFA
jgi:hypothetical protein